MFIKISLLRLICFFSFIFLLPIFQKQWFNLYIFNGNSFSFYSILYYLSGIICPIFVCCISNNYFTFYEFKKLNTKSNNAITGKILFALVLLILIPFSMLIVNYFYINLDLIFHLFLNRGLYSKINIIYHYYIILTFFILLIFKKTRIMIKRFSLLNFFLISLILWYFQTNNIQINNNIPLLFNFIDINNYNFFNIIYLFTIESFYYMWSCISYQHNLSDWSVQKSLISEVLYIYKIALFYSIIALYYSVL